MESKIKKYMSFRVNNTGQTTRQINKRPPGFPSLTNNGRFAIPGGRPASPQSSTRIVRPASPQGPPQRIVRPAVARRIVATPLASPSPQLLNTHQLDTHQYDGKLAVHQSLMQTIQTQQKNADQDLTVEKTSLFARLIEDLKRNPQILDKYRSTAIQAVNHISHDIRKPPNFDGSNGLFADDVLYIVCKQIDESKNVETLKYVAEQLSDIITSGPCAQGRSTRIFQVLFSLESYVQEIDEEK